jgi:hypothetical protein
VQYAHAKNVVIDLRKKVNLGVILLTVSFAIVAGFAVSGLLTTQKKLTNTGSVKAINVEVYWDFECTQVVSSVDWGAPEPGDPINKTVYIKNSGTAPMTLSLSCSDWNPVEAENYLTLSWDSEGTEINAGEVIPAVMTLSVSPSVTGITVFSFDSLIEGIG